MDCSICFNAITSATGKVELSCSHPFHFSCLTTWFDKQKIQGACENCPLCRHEANDFEKMPAGLQDEEDDDETWDADDDDYRLQELAAQERARNLFERLKFINPIEEVELYAANRIKACWRGYQDRLLYLELLANKHMIERHEEYISNVKNYLKSDIQRGKFLKSIIGLSRTQVKHLAATKIQSILRMYNMKVIMKEGPKQFTLPPGIWVEKSVGQWQRVIMNPEEDIPSNIQCHPLSTVI